MKGPASFDILDFITDTTTPAEFLQLLADRGEDINGFMPGQGIHITLLYGTMRRYSMGHAEFLLRCGADVNAQCDYHGSSALFLLLDRDLPYVSFKRWMELFQYYGSDVNMVNSLGLSPLVAAVDSGPTWAVEILMDAGAVIDKTLADRYYDPVNEDDKRALHRRDYAYMYAERIERRKRNCCRTLCAFYAYARQARMSKDLAFVVMHIVWSAERRNVVWEYI